MAGNFLLLFFFLKKQKHAFSGEKYYFKLKFKFVWHLFYNVKQSLCHFSHKNISIYLPWNFWNENFIVHALLKSYLTFGFLPSSDRSEQRSLHSNICTLSWILESIKRTEDSSPLHFLSFCDQWRLGKRSIILFKGAVSWDF